MRVRLAGRRSIRSKWGETEHECLSPWSSECVAGRFLDSTRVAWREAGWEVAGWRE